MTFRVRVMMSAPLESSSSEGVVVMVVLRAGGGRVMLFMSTRKVGRVGKEVVVEGAEEALLSLAASCPESKIGSKRLRGA